MKRIFFISLVLLFVSSCQKDNVRTSLLGGWNVTEIDEASGVQANFQANIIRDAANPSNYNIYNFHNLGNNNNIYVQFHENEDGQLIIENQSIEGTNAWVQGTGKYVEDYSSIEWVYTFNDGIEQFVIANYY